MADGANLHWASGSKTVWFVGKPNPRRALATAVGCVLQELEEKAEGAG